MSDATPAAAPSLSSSLRVSGIVSLVSGVACLFLPLLAGTIAVVILGLAILVAGLASFDAARRAPAGIRGRKRYVVESLAVAAVGALLVFSPVVGSAIITWALAIPALVVGVSRIAASFELKPRPDWTRVLGAGVVMTLLGLLLLAGWPFSGATITGIALGFAFILDGVVRLTAARALSAKG